MPRPNVDIPWRIHGRVKEHAANEDISLEQAYHDLLRSGLDGVVPTTDVSDLSFSDLYGGDTLNYDGIVDTPYGGDGGDNINKAFAVLTAASDCHDPYVATATPKHQSVTYSQFANALKYTFNQTECRGDAFVIAQEGGCWQGSGPSVLHRTLQDTAQRWEEAEFSIYKYDLVSYLLQLNENVVMGITARNSVDRGLHDLNIRFLFDGVPLNGSTYASIVKQFGFSGLGPASEAEHYETFGTGYADTLEPGRYPLDVTREITATDEYGTEWVIAVEAENPLRTHPDLLDGYLNEHPEYEAGALQQPERLLIEMRQHYEPGDDVMLSLSTLRTHNYLDLFGRQVYGAYVQANWQRTDESAPLEDA